MRPQNYYYYYLLNEGPVDSAAAETLAAAAHAVDEMARAEADEARPASADADPTQVTRHGATVGHLVGRNKLHSLQRRVSWWRERKLD